MNEELLLSNIVKDFKSKLYILSEALRVLVSAAYPYAKDDEDLMKAIKRINRIMGYKNL